MNLLQGGLQLDHATAQAQRQSRRFHSTVSEALSRRVFRIVRGALEQAGADQGAVRTGCEQVGEER